MPAIVSRADAQRIREPNADFFRWCGSRAGWRGPHYGGGLLVLWLTGNLGRHTRLGHAGIGPPPLTRTHNRGVCFHQRRAAMVNHDLNPENAESTTKTKQTKGTKASVPHMAGCAGRLSRTNLCALGGLCV
jgi:hypothetical protein